MRHRTAAEGSRHFLQQRGTPQPQVNIGPQDDRLIVGTNHPIWRELDIASDSTGADDYNYAAIYRMAGNPLREIITESDLQP